MKKLQDFAVFCIEQCDGVSNVMVCPTFPIDAYLFSSNYHCIWSGAFILKTEGSFLFAPVSNFPVCY
jgi:hypothetical protein